MSRYLRSSREELKAKVFSKLNLSLTDDTTEYPPSQDELTSTSHEHLDRLLKETCTFPPT